MTLRSIAIVQARAGSTRLPGKVLMDLCGAPVLDHVLRRCMAIPGIGGVCCATTTKTEDDAVAELAKRAGATVFRGAKDDVLDRYHRAAKDNGVDVVLRVTSDCPLIDPGVCGEVLSLRARDNADFATNNIPPSWPHGLDCEAFTAALLDRAARTASKREEREHVSPWMRVQGDVRKANLPCPRPGLAHHRWTIDFAEDLEFFRALFARLPTGPTLPGYEAALDVLAKDPSIARLNAARAESSRQHASASR